jgi:hypothetical protein
MAEVWRWPIENRTGKAMKPAMLETTSKPTPWRFAGSGWCQARRRGAATAPATSVRKSPTRTESISPVATLVTTGVAPQMTITRHATMTGVTVGRERDRGFKA